MIHARKDYSERIIDKAGLIPDEEPVFLLRGQDVFAARTLEFYAEELRFERTRLEDEYREALNDNLLSPNEITRAASRIDDLLSIEFDTRNHASKMRMWPTKKVPDMFPEAKPSEDDLDDTTKGYRESLGYPVT